jgi:hypothetical protein
VTDLPLNEFDSYRYESFDGINYTIAVDSSVFVVDADDGLFCLSDFAYFQTCFGRTAVDSQTSVEGLCGVFDLDSVAGVDLTDFAAVTQISLNP